MLHDWGDEDCVTILKNCHKALREDGRLLIREHVIDPSRNSAAKTGAALNSDVRISGAKGGRGPAQSGSACWERQAFLKCPF